MAPPFDPDTGDRRLSDEGIAEARRFLAERFPDLRDAPLTESRVCQYENTSNGDFLIDRHPEMRERLAGRRRFGSRLQAWTGGGRVCGGGRILGGRTARSRALRWMSVKPNGSSDAAGRLVDRRIKAGAFG